MVKNPLQEEKLEKHLGVMEGYIFRRVVCLQVCSYIKINHAVQLSFGYLIYLENDWKTKSLSLSGY